MADVNISKYRASVVRSGSTPATPGFVVSEGQNPVEPAGSEQNHLPVTINATANALAITTDQVLSGAGTVGQYIRGDGSLADFPASTGGGSSVSYYLNGSISQGTIGGVAYKELSKTPILGSGTQFTINADGYIASFLTDAGDPNLLEIPGGNWNFETYFSASSGGGSPTFYVELYKYDGSTFTLIASNSGSPELIAFGTNVNSYFSTLAVPTTALTLTDRLAIRYYVTHSGRTITLHTENNTLCQIITTFTTGLTALNGLTAQVQYFAVGTSGTDFNIASATQTHTFNLPTASATNRGALSSADWSTFNAKQNALTLTTTGSSGASTLVGATLNVPTYTLSGLGGVPTSRQLTINGTAFDLSADRSWSVGTVTSVGLSSATSGVTIGNTPVTGSGTITLAIATASGSQQGLLSASDWSTFNNKQNTITLTTTGTSGAATLVGSTLNIPQYQSVLTNPITGTGTTNYLAKFTGSTTVGNSQVFDNGSGVGIGGTNTDSLLTINGTAGTTHERFREGSTTIGFIGGANGLITGQNGKLAVRAEAGLVLSSQGNSPDVLITSGNLLVGTTSDNGARLQVSGRAYINNVGGSVAGTTIYGNDQSNVRLRLENVNGRTWELTGGLTGANNSDFTIYDVTASATRMVINFSGNVGIGTASVSGTYEKLAVAGGISIKDNTNAKLEIGRYNTTGAQNSYIKLGANSNSLRFTNNTDIADIMELTNSGNLGLGVTPSAWDAGNDVKAFQFGPRAALWNFSTNNVFLGLNYYWNGTNRIYIGSSAATEYQQITGEHRWLTAPSGTAGNAISFTQAMTLNASGNLLVGTTTDNGARLQVSGSATIGGNLTVSSGNNLNMVTGDIHFQSNAGYGILSANGNRLVSIQNGAFGVTGAATFSSSVNVGGVSANTDFRIYRTVAPSVFFSVSAPGGTPNTSILGINGTDVMSLNASGNVGIGTSSPGYKIEVAGANSQYWNGTAFTGTPLALAISNTTAGGYDPVLILQQADSGGTVKNAGAIGLVGRASWTAGNNASQISDMYFLVRNSSGGISERMRISSTGNVGIGTASPGTLLHVNGYSAANWISTQSNTGTSGHTMYFGYNNGSNTTYGLYITGGRGLANQLDFAVENKFYVNGNGNVLIGTTTDSGDKLRVNGNTFTNTIMTYNPENDNRSGVAWRLGAASIGAVTPNRRLRVNVGGVEYYIGAVEV